MRNKNVGIWVSLDSNSSDGTYDAIHAFPLEELWGSPSGMWTLLGVVNAEYAERAVGAIEGAIAAGTWPGSWPKLWAKVALKLQGYFTPEHVSVEEFTKEMSHYL